MKRNEIKEKSFDFAVRIYNLSKYLKENKAESIFRNQIVRCGTSIAANVEEAIASISKTEFSSKISISYKEARETMFWLRLLYKTKTINEKQFRSLSNDCDEILKILFSILRTTRIGKKE